MAANSDLYGELTFVQTSGRGYIFVCQVDEDDPKILHCSNATQIYSWGTSCGFGELSAGPTTNTQSFGVPGKRGSLHIYKDKIEFMYPVKKKHWQERIEADLAKFNNYRAGSTAKGYKFVQTASRGYIFVGRQTDINEEVLVLSEPCQLYSWGTELGFGELRNGPVQNTMSFGVLTEHGRLRINSNQLEFTYDIEDSAWSTRFNVDQDKTMKQVRQNHSDLPVQRDDQP